MANARPKRPVVPANSGDAPQFSPSNQASEFELIEPWKVRVSTNIDGLVTSRDLPVTPVERVSVVDELHWSLPIFDPDQYGWLQGTRLYGVSAQEGVIPGILVDDSIIVTIEGSEEPLVRDVDYVVDPYWGTIGRTESGRLSEIDCVRIRYEYIPPRIDTVVLRSDGTIDLITGTPSVSAPAWSDAGQGGNVLGRIYQKGPSDGLSLKNLYPVRPIEPLDGIQQRPGKKPDKLRSVFRKLRTGKELRILAWGDSVTDGQYLSLPTAMRWQEQFVEQLKSAYPKARITLMTEAWPGHGSADYLAARPDDPKNFATAVLGLKPDLVISEFVNDGYLSESETRTRYARIASMMRQAGIDWIAMTPHFTSPEFMSGGPDFNGGEDPRPYVDGLRKFGAETGVNIADASALWADLKAQGIPYVSLLSNGINHPNAEGLSIYANSLMRIFVR